MKLFNIDLHVSVIADLKDIFTSLGHTVDDVCLSDHSWVLQKYKENIPILNNWQEQLSPQLCDIFYNIYKDSLQQYDAFIVTYPPSFSLLFEKFNKPIIIYVPIRYEVPFTNNPALLKWFNDFLKKGIDNKQITLVANSVYDQKYCEYFLDRSCTYIPSWCSYGDKYPKWTGTNTNFLFFNNMFYLNIPGFSNICKPYTWGQIESYQGIVHLPYNISTMSMYEQYTANTPLFFPSQEFLLNLMKENPGILNQLTWNKTFGLPSSINPDPNNYSDLNIVKSWLPYAEYYNQESMPYITYFNSFPELLQLKQNTNVFEISKKMESFNVIKKEKIYQSWKIILDSIENVNAPRGQAPWLL